MRAENREYAQPSDVYSYGVICYELASRQPFFGNQRFMAVRTYLSASLRLRLTCYQALEVDIIAGRRPELPSDTPPEFAQVIQCAWATEPDDRAPIEVRHVLNLFLCLIIV